MYFINEAFHKGVQDYLDSKDKPEGVLFNSFLVVVVRMLRVIYGELDIVNPFRIQSEEALIHNFMKYGYSKDDLNEFFKLLDGFLVTEKRNLNAIKKETNTYFIEVQKKLIDMFNIKRINFDVMESDSREFFDLLYTPGTSNALRLSYNFLHAEDTYQIAEYYKNAMSEKKKEEVVEEKKDILGFDIYKLFNVSISDISKMNKEDVDNLNKEIYRSFDISENAMNKDYLLNEKIKEWQRQNNPITTGNGYVDILLIISIIVTVVMIIVIFITLIF